MTLLAATKFEVEMTSEDGDESGHALVVIEVIVSRPKVPGRDSIEMDTLIDEA